MVDDLGVEKKWFSYQAEAYRKIAIEWCKENDMEYTCQYIGKIGGIIIHMSYINSQQRQKLNAYYKPEGFVIRFCSGCDE